MQPRRLANFLTPQECSLLGRFTFGAGDGGAVNAATGNPTQDYLLFEFARRLAQSGVARELLGPEILLWGLRLIEAADAAASVLDLLPSVHGFTLLAPAGTEAGALRLVIDTRDGRRIETEVETGSAMLVPAAAALRVAGSVSPPTRLLVARYAAPGTGLLDARGEQMPAITLSGNQGLNDNGRLSPIRGPRNAFALPETYRPIATSGAEATILVAGHTDILTDVSIAAGRGASAAALPLHERLLIGCAADRPAAVYVPAGCPPPEPDTAQGRLEIAWTGTPAGYGQAVGEVVELSPGAAIETVHLSRLAVEHRQLAPGESWSAGIRPCDTLLVVRSGQVELRGEVLTAPALALLPAGVPVGCDASAEAALTIATFQGMVGELARPGASSGGPVVFCIPVAARRMAKDWHHTCRLLQATLGSLYRQSDPNWRVIVIGNEPPELTLPLDDRFEFIATTLDLASEKLRDVQADAGHKRYVAEQRARERGADYIFFCDADDLIGRDVVAYIRRNRHPYGYVLGRGVIVDEERGIVAPLPLQNDVLPLEEQTASAFAFNADAVPAIIASPIDTGGHPRYRENMYRSGRPMLDLPFAAVAYLRFTQENMSDLRAREDKALMPLHGAMRAAIAARPLARTPELVAYYNLDGGAGQEAGPLTLGPKRLSVLVCTHRRSDGLQRLLETLSPQVAGRPDREIVVVNDGTHDAGYAEVVARFAPVIRYVALPRSVGIAVARNRSAEQARGAYMVFTDDDCEAPPHWLDWLDATLRAHDELDVLAGTTRPLRPEAANFVGKAQAHFNLLPFPHALGPVDQCFVTACLAVRASTFRRVGGFSTGYPYDIAGEDTDLSLRLVRSGARTRIDADWYVYHQLGRSLAVEMRRFRRYGRANRQIGQLPSAPDTYRRLAAMRPHLLPAKFGEHLRQTGAAARDYDGNILEAFRARVAVALIQTAYDRGAADR